MAWDLAMESMTSMSIPWFTCAAASACPWAISCPSSLRVFRLATATRALRAMAYRPNGTWDSISVPARKFALTENIALRAEYVFDSMFAETYRYTGGNVEYDWTSSTVRLGAMIRF